VRVASSISDDALGLRHAGQQVPAERPDALLPVEQRASVPDALPAERRVSLPVEPRASVSDALPAD